MVEAGLQEVDTYVSLCHNTVAQFVATRPTFDLCLASERRPGQRVYMKWWEQGELVVKGVRRRIGRRNV